MDVARSLGRVGEVYFMSRGGVDECLSAVSRNVVSEDMCSCTCVPVPEKMQPTQFGSGSKNESDLIEGGRSINLRRVLGVDVW